MSENTTHWTARSRRKFLYRIASDFVEQLRDRIDVLGWSQKRLAKELKLSPGRVSQILNNPGNLTLGTMIEWARSLGMKVSIVAYFDDDPQNEHGPVNSEIFRLCWDKVGRPRNFLALQHQQPEQTARTGLATLKLPVKDACSITERKRAINDPGKRSSQIQQIYIEREATTGGDLWQKHHK